MQNAECRMQNDASQRFLHSAFCILHFSHSLPPPATTSSITLLINSFNSFPGLKYGIFLDGTSTFSPVLGLRPVRDLRLRRRKLPNPRSSIFCPARRESTIESKTMLTIVSACFLVNWTTRATSSTSSALVITPALASGSSSDDCWSKVASSLMTLTTGRENGGG